MNLPRHPDHEDDAPTRTGPSARALMIIAAVAAVLVLMVVLHLTGVIGAGVHSGGR